MSNKGKRRVEYYEFSIGKFPRKVSKYERRSQRRKDAYSLLPLWIVIGSIVVGNVSNGIGSIISQVFAQEPELLSPYVKPYETVYEDDLVREVRIDEADVSSNFSVPLQQDYSLETREDIENYILEVFGEEIGKVAIAVGMSESHLIPEKTLIADAGHYSWSSPTYKGECSVGLFMINLASDGCNGKRVHYDKVPGDTLEQKIEWLKDPKNNIDFAKKIYDSRGNFTAWSAYTGGGYKKFIK